MSEVLKHSVELGVYKIYIYESSFSRKKKHFKKERAMKILKEAAKQSGNPYIPEVLIVSMEKLSTPGIFMHIDGGKIQDYNQYKGENLIIVGPEGDFEVSEVTKLKNKGFYPVKFGNFILRSETAVLSAVSAAKVLWGSFYEEVSILRF